MSRCLDYDSTPIPAGYDRARAHSPEVRDLWLQTVARFIQPGSPSQILDVGCGTGRFSLPMAHHFTCPVFGIDPSLRMLAQAKTKAASSQARVSYIRGRGEELPIRESSIDLIFMSMVFHHFRDPYRVAKECRRVLTQNGTVFLRAATVEQIPAYPYVPFFPESVPMMVATLPTTSFVQDVFQSARFRAIEHGVVTQEFAPSYHEYAEKIAAGGDSILMRLPKSAFAAGLESLRAYAANAGAEPVEEPIDFFVFRSPGRESSASPGF